MAKNNYILLLLIPVVFVACSSNNEETTVTQKRPVKHLVPGNSSSAEVLIFSGVSRPSDEEQLSFKVGGVIRSILVDVGQPVRRNQTLATLDPSDYQVTLNQAQASQQASQAQLKSAEASYLAAQSGYKRAQNLYATQSISLNDFENAKASYESALAGYEAARAQLEASKSQTVAANNQVAYTKLTAGLDGVVTQINVNENELVGSGTPILNIASQNDLEIEVGVPESAISRIRRDQQVEIRFTSMPAQSFTGTVTEIGYSAAGATYPVRVSLPEDNPNLRPDMPAEVFFRTNMPGDSVGTKTLLPSTAVGSDQEGYYIFKLIPSDQSGVFIAQKTYVEVGQLRDAGFELISGLDAQTRIASSGLNVLRNGMEVTLYNPQQ